MTIAHLSDTHLGFRAYGKFAASGLNQREEDVMESFRLCLRAILDRDPDLVVHSGDLFHVVRPSNTTLVTAYHQLSKFQLHRGFKPFVLIGGNHDTPRTAESGNLLPLFGTIGGVVVVPAAARSEDFPDLDLEVLCVPSQSLVTAERVDWAPQLGRRHKVLTVHGVAAQTKLREPDFDVSDAKPQRWDYVALGDYHVHQAYAPNVCYAGATDFTSTNIWEESLGPKGWVWFDSQRGELEFVPVATRRVIDMPRIDAAELDGEALSEALVAAARWSDQDDPIVRQRVTNVSPEVRARLSQESLRAIRERSLAYLFECFPPAASGTGKAGAEGAAQPLEASWEAHADSAALPLGVEREKFKAGGLELLKEVEELETASIEA